MFNILEEYLLIKSEPNIKKCENISLMIEEISSNDSDEDYILNDFVVNNGFSIPNEKSSVFNRFLNVFQDLVESIDKDAFVKSLSEDNEKFWIKALNYCETLIKRKKIALPFSELDKEKQLDIIKYIFDNSVLYRNPLNGDELNGVTKDIISLCSKMISSSRQMIVELFYSKANYIDQINRWYGISEDIAADIWEIFIPHMTILQNHVIIEKLRFLDNIGQLENCDE